MVSRRTLSLLTLLIAVTALTGSAHARSSDSSIWSTALDKAAPLRGALPSIEVDRGAIWVTAGGATSILDVRTGAKTWKTDDTARIVRASASSVVAARGASLVQYDDAAKIVRRVAICGNADSAPFIGATPDNVAAYCSSERRFVVRDSRTLAERYAMKLDAANVGVSSLARWGFAVTQFAMYPGHAQTYVYRRGRNDVISIGPAFVASVSDRRAILLEATAGSAGVPNGEYVVSTLRANGGTIERARSISCPRRGCALVYRFALEDSLFFSDAVRRDLYEVPATGSAEPGLVKRFSGAFDRVVASDGSRALVQTTNGELFVLAQRAGVLRAVGVGRAANPRGTASVTKSSIALLSSVQPGRSIVVDLRSAGRLETNDVVVAAQPAGEGRAALLSISPNGQFEVKLVRTAR